MQKLALTPNRILGRLAAADFDALKYCFELRHLRTRLPVGSSLLEQVSNHAGLQAAQILHFKQLISSFPQVMDHVRQFVVLLHRYWVECGPCGRTRCLKAAVLAIAAVAPRGVLVQYCMLLAVLSAQAGSLTATPSMSTCV